ncbi:MAG TPA: BMP family ABC transporter substrate-binding protein [Candidatus Limnocylindrales bacterium]|nr:BMP family ABC transporter substrate-binding protein [Candidatus Limnocylindrales bacterium]
MRSSMRLLSLGATAAILFAACSSGGGAATSAPSAAPSDSAAPSESASASASAGGGGSKDYTACVAFDTGGLGDKGFNDLAKLGLENAAAAGYTTFFSEAQGSTDYSANIQRLLDQGCKTIVAVGFNQGAAVAEKALANPDVAFSQVDTTWAGGPGAGPDFTPGTPDDIPVPPNFTGLDYQIDQAAMLAGYLAAGFSKSGKIGTYGGQPFAGVTRFMDGLYAGIKYWNEKKGANVELLGWDGDKTGSFVGGNNPWNDPAKGEQLAQALLDQGVDVVHPVSGATGNGSIKAMSEAGKWAIGVDTDQYVSIGPPTNAAILTSAQKAIDVSVMDVIDKNAGGDLGGEDYSGTLENAGVLLSPFHDLDSQVSAELKGEIDALSTAIKDGSVKVCTYLKRGC